MEIILIKDVEKLGTYGEIKNVKDGFARNYLIPHGFAVAATPEAKEKAEREKEKYLKEREAKLKEIEKLKKEFEKLSLEFKVKTADEKMFGSVTGQDVASEIYKEIKIEVDKRDIEMETIHALGDFEAKIKLGEGINAKIKLKLLKESDNDKKSKK